MLCNLCVIPLAKHHLLFAYGAEAHRYADVGVEVIYPLSETVSLRKSLICKGFLGILFAFYLREGGTEMVSIYTH